MTCQENGSVEIEERSETASEAHSLFMEALLTGHGNLDDNIRMLKNFPAKFAGRTIYLWGGESPLPTRLATARQNAPEIHAADPQMIGNQWPHQLFPKVFPAYGRGIVSPSAQKMSLASCFLAGLYDVLETGIDLHPLARTRPST